MLQCSNCNHDNPRGARFCAQCGVRLAQQCTACGEAIAAEQRFCTGCGAAQSDDGVPAGGAELAHTPANYTPPHLAERILAHRQTLRGEKKQVSVLFCDMVDSTVLAGELGAERMHVLLSDFFTRVLTEVHRFEGTVNQFLGDGFMAIFGAPLAYEDHAARAGLAAIAIRDAVASARESSTVAGWNRVHVRIGINSGQVVVGAIGDDLRMDYTAAGDTTHLAARLQSAASPGEILCGKTTIAAARGALEVEALASITLKGITEPVARYRLLNAREHTSRIAQRQTAFVGRDAEMTQLLAGVQQAAQGHGGVIELEGEPGAGKSRLVLEFQARLPADTCAVLGQCITYGNQRPNVPIVELVRGLFETATDNINSPSETDDGHDYLAALLGGEEALSRIKEMDPATVRGRTVQALIAYVLRRAQRSPLVLLIEDLHWADPSSLEYLSALATALRDSRCLLVVTFRPGSDPPWSAAIRRGKIRLTPLNAAAVQSLLAQLLVSSVLPREQQDQVLARAEGNPFFLEELVRAAVSTGEQVPGDVFEVLGARIDRLTINDKRNLRTAAVIGREFSLDLVEEVADGPREQRTRLEHLTALGFIEPTLTPRHYRFVHALTQEVAYQGMVSDERRQLHTALATRLATRGKDPEQDCEEISRHHLAGETPALALPFLEAATAKAIRNHTLEAAHGFLVDAMRLFEAEEMTAERLIRCVVYLLQAFPVFHFLHKHREYAERLEHYAPQVEALNVPAVLGPFLAQRGHRLWVVARYAEAEIVLKRAISLCDEENDSVSAAHASIMLGWLYANRGQCELGEQYGLRALRYLEQVPVPLFPTFSNVALLLCAAFRGRWPEAVRHGERARDVGLAAHDDGMASFGGGFLAWVLYEMGDASAAMAEAQAAFNIAPTNYFKGWSATFMAAAMARLGQAEEAVNILEQAVGYAEQAGHLSGYALVALLRGEARVHAGEFDQAWREMDALRALVVSLPYSFVAAGALQVQAECALHTNRAPLALELFRLAETEFAAIDAAHRVAQVRAGAERAMRAIHAGKHS
ncbi:MAG: AAA family ATPase [Gammaproteobacteria bacterium]|nr:AAA family ATPase [Gammaproteobacteria bacterium]